MVSGVILTQTDWLYRKRVMEALQHLIFRYLGIVGAYFSIYRRLR